MGAVVAGSIVEVTPVPRVNETSTTFAEVFEQHLSMVWRVLRYLGVPESDVEDVAQEVFVVVHRKLPGFEGRSALTSWLYSICWRTYQDYRRRAFRRHEVLSDPPPGTAQAATQERDLETEQRLAALAKFLEGLDEDKRTVFVLFELEELEMKEVVAIVGCPLQTGYTRLRVARTHVKNAWERQTAREKRP